MYAELLEAPQIKHPPEHRRMYISEANNAHLKALEGFRRAAAHCSLLLRFGHVAHLIRRQLGHTARKVDSCARQALTKRLLLLPPQMSCAPG
jgi:hypothetical protein